MRASSESPNRSMPAQPPDVGQLVGGEDGHRSAARRPDLFAKSLLALVEGLDRAVFGHRQHQRPDRVAHLVVEPLLGQRAPLDGVVQEPGRHQLVVEAGLVKQGRHLDHVSRKGRRRWAALAGMCGAARV